MVKKLIYPLLALLFFFLVGCGFHLRGLNGNLELKYPLWSIHSGGDLTLPLQKELLRRRGVQVKEDEKAAVLAFNLVDFNRQTQSINRYGGVDDYVYTLHIKAQVYYHGEPWGEPFDLTLQRYMTYRTDSLVVQDEERLIREELFNNMADRVVNRLYFLPPLPQSQPSL